MTNSEIKPPIADKTNHISIVHGDTLHDDYFWMRLSDAQKEAEIPDDPTKKVIAYLNAENTYREKAMQHTKAFQEKLYEEIKGRIKQIGRAHV